MNRLFRTIVIAMTAPAFFSACASTFVASKDGKGYYVGSGSDAAYRMFCESGDLRKILTATTKLSEDMKNDLYRFNCENERSNGKVRQIFSSMTPAQRKDLRQAFKNNGYDINAMRC
jgi:hypothetical protein